MRDLFADEAPARAPVSSGPVPRNVLPGIVWDGAAEDAYRQAVEDYRKSFDGKWALPQFAADVDREARWLVEQSLYRAFLKERVMEALRASTDREKVALVADWRRLYGNPRTDYLVKVLRTPALKSLVLSYGDKA